MKSYLMVESYPSHPGRVEEFNQWYDQVHVPEVCAIDGFVGATRLAPATADGGGYVVLYELDGDPEACVAGVKAAAAAGKFNMSDALSMGPIPKLRIMNVVQEYRAPE